MADHTTHPSSSTVRKRGGLASPTCAADGDIPAGSVPRPYGGAGRRTGSVEDDGPAGGDGRGALVGASGAGLMGEELRSDYVLQPDGQADPGTPLGDSHLTLLDEVVLLGLKDQQVRGPACRPA